MKVQKTIKDGEEKKTTTKDVEDKKPTKAVEVKKNNQRRRS